MKVGPWRAGPERRAWSQGAGQTPRKRARAGAEPQLLAAPALPGGKMVARRRKRPARERDDRIPSPPGYTGEELREARPGAVRHRQEVFGGWRRPRVPRSGRTVRCEPRWPLAPGSGGREAPRTQEALFCLPTLPGRACLRPRFPWVSPPLSTPHPGQTHFRPHSLIQVSPSPCHRLCS